MNAALMQELIAAARGEIEVDLLLAGGSIANVLSGEICRSDVAIFKGRIAGFDCCSAAQVLDMSGKTLAPGFIDGHVHIESSMVTVPEFARAVVPRGTTTVVADPHEIANVWGEAGIRYMLRSSRNLPLNVFVMLPTCVPATNLETAGASLGADELAGMMQDEGVLGLAEVMNYPGVVFRDPEVMKKLSLAGGRPVDGHCPGLSGRDLSAYVSAGIRSDHECTSIDEAREKLRSGMYIMLREGSAAKNLLDLLPLVSSKNARQFLFVSDDRHPADILSEGHIDFMVKTAIEQGMDPIIALQIASLNAAQCFGLRDLGAIAPGYRADIAILDELEHPRVVKVIKDGRVVAEDGDLIARLSAPAKPEHESMHISPLSPQSFEIPAEEGPARVIGIVAHQIITRSLRLLPKIVQGKVVSDPDRDILKMAVIERHRATGNVGLGLVQGTGLIRGAIATSVAHDSHNVAAVGVSDEEMLAAVQAIEQMGGGLVAVAEGKTLASLPLPVAGLLSEGYMRDVAEEIAECIDAAHDLGSKLEDPFMTLSFLSLPVIPELKLTDRGLVDVGEFRLVGMFGEEG
ncbi:MAG: cryptic adenine deaminase [Methanosaeta sp. PtaU1.Bin112]|nr:MAG: cryptic adenine deaminase [Methanosaeta sp. PtaU1.Bin112]